MLLGGGVGTFDVQPPVTTSDGEGNGTGPTGIASGDFGADGILDSVTADHSGHISLLLGSADGTFVSAPKVFATFDTGTCGIAVGYFNHDVPNLLDVATSNEGSVSIFLGDIDNGIGFVSPPTNIASFGTDAVLDVTTKDFNLDGNTDLAVVYGTTKFGTLAGNGDGTFTGPTEVIGPISGPVSLSVADFDGDGKPDVATADSGSNKTSVFRNTTTVSGVALQIRKMAAQAEVNPGQPVTYILRYVNAGDTEAAEVVITDTIPISVSPLSISSSPIVTPETGSRYIWQIEDLAAGARGVITITGVLTDGLAIGEAIANTAQISSEATETVTTDNESTAIVRVPCARPISSRATPTPDFILCGRVCWMYAGVARSRSM